MLHSASFMLLVLAAVDCFLADEAADFLTQLWIVDVALERAHAVDEELLAFRERQRQGIEERRAERIVAVPVARQAVGEIELGMTRIDRHLDRCTGQGGH